MTLHRRQIRSFVSRGRLTQGQQQALDVLGPRYCLRVENGMVDFPSVFKRDAEVILDIGFGAGESLLALAQQHPEKDYLGVEVYAVGVGSLLMSLEKIELNNIRVYQCDVVDVLNQCIKDESLSGINVFFPDPWPKRKHHKRRLVQTNFVNLLVQKLKPGGFLHLATDWENYAKQMLSVLSACDSLEESQEKHHDRPSTRFARRGKRLGHAEWDFLYIKKRGM